MTALCSRQIPSSFFEKLDQLPDFHYLLSLVHLLSSIRHLMQLDRNLYLGYPPLVEVFSEMIQ